MRIANQETEVKFLVAGLAECERRLQALNARQVQPRTHELNLRFDNADGAFRKSGRVLRLRRDTTVRLTYKDPGRQEAGAISRREIEITVSDSDAAQRLLEALGYGISFVYEKYRTTYVLGTVEVMLDELPFGNFVEIEGSRAGLRPTAEHLGLDWAAAIPRSYHDIFDNLQSIWHLPFRDLTFANFEGREVAAGDLGARPADSQPPSRDS